MRSGHHPRLTGCRGCNPDAGLAVGFAGRITGFPATEWSVTRKPAAPAEKGSPRRFTPPGALARVHERMAGFLACGSPPYAPPSQAQGPVASQRLARRSQLRGQPRHGHIDAAPRSRLIPGGNHPGIKLRADTGAVNAGAIDPSRRRNPRHCRTSIASMGASIGLLRRFANRTTAIIGVFWLLITPAAAARAAPIYVIAGGWHTELALPVGLI